MEINDCGTFIDVLKTKQLEQHIGEYIQAQRETLAAEGRQLLIEPGRYPVVTDHLAKWIEHGAIVFDATCEWGEEQTVVAVKSAEELSQLVRDGTVRLSVDPALLLEPDPSWSLQKHPAFEFTGPSGNRALADLIVLSREGAVPVVVATERDDNPGISITNGCSQACSRIALAKPSRSCSSSMIRAPLRSAIASARPSRPSGTLGDTARRNTFRSSEQRIR